MRGSARMIVLAATFAATLVPAVTSAAAPDGTVVQWNFETCSVWAWAFPHFSATTNPGQVAPPSSVDCGALDSVDAGPIRIA